MSKLIKGDWFNDLGANQKSQHAN